ncbi:MAG: DUF418 domain-containing protein [Planctomycetota bacterium]|nr:DUF418 domain-containing protein [Planctomycetota bacterium]
MNAERAPTAMESPVAPVVTGAATQSPPATRVVGFDVARAVAIFGMAVIHFNLVMTDGDSGWLQWVLDRFAGRPAAVFMILAGIGIAIRSRQAAEQGAAAIHSARRVLVQRGVFFLVCGFVFLTVWPGDILRVYGVSFLIAAPLLLMPSRLLLILAASIIAAFVGMVFLLDFSAGWNFETLDYAGLWTAQGATRNLLFNGFRAVFPWTALLLTGICLGRIDWSSQAVRRTTILCGLMATTIAEVISRPLVAVAVAAGNPNEDAIAVFGTDSLPAMPLFLLSAGGLACAAIAACVGWAEARPRGLIIRSLAATGQTAFTWYIAHVVVGIGGLYAIGFVQRHTSLLALATATGAFALVMFSSHVYRHRFCYGPLEWVLRRVAG